MKSIVSLFLTLSLAFAAQKSTQTVAVAGGMWPMPPLIQIWTDSKLVLMPKASLSSMKNSVLLDFFPKLEMIQTSINDNENIEELLKLNAHLYICHKAKGVLCEKLQKAGKNALNLGVNIDNYNSKKTLAYWLENLAQYFPIEKKNKKLI
ncbi:hypothetical protein OQH60_06965, partial [Campylobacter sp. MIT 21-1685]|nr:hypothetical protein [Campylobacter sp. MIT 21-1684]MCX2751888.1 hypothetical protein [Campylobacter sp. MIT 21-1682]MCX2808089.1 hypothetical protein [Campylobacter sp. MIT 21-1685]